MVKSILKKTTTTSSSKDTNSSNRTGSTNDDQITLKSALTSSMFLSSSSNGSIVRSKSSPSFIDNINNSNNITNNNKSNTKNSRRHVVFSNVIIYEFPNILGDNPATANGCPISIGWYHHSKNIMDINFYEYIRCTGSVSSAGSGSTITSQPPSTTSSTIATASSYGHCPRRTRRQMLLRAGERDSYLLGIGYRLDELMDCAEEIRKIRDSRYKNMKDSKWNKIITLFDNVGKGVVTTTIDVSKNVFDVSKIIVIDGIVDSTIHLTKNTTKVAINTTNYAVQGALSTTNYAVQGAYQTTSYAVQGTTKAASEFARVTSNVFINNNTANSNSTTTSSSNNDGTRNTGTTAMKSPQQRSKRRSMTGASSDVSSNTSLPNMRTAMTA